VSASDIGQGAAVLTDSGARARGAQGASNLSEL